MKSNPNSRRNAIQQIGLLTTGIFMLPSVSCNESRNIKETTSQPPPLPFLILPKEPLAPGAMGGDMRTLIRSAQTNKQFSCVEAVLAPKKIAGSPHKHADLDELMYVMEGTASVLMDNEVIEVSAGSWHLRPRGIVHVVWNSGNENLRLIDMYFNQNFEDYLEEVYHQIIPEVIKRNITFEEPAIAKRIAELDKKFGLTYYPEQQQALLDKYGLS
ncbi:MAG: cupin domain-containing protein [Candidatus Pseudobacter hemicellulosilyticus]|uniref:Cupin domain-containing protein n=1 Tax=Candidatus Pseudobacter hemicellulosilyticus TaxID=3121375 RepID=A0AAJ5WR17_9BACT|nr:MAG: cupin domain-containing protein [Pseudobacter sp.]